MAYDTRQSPSRVNGFKIGRNNRIMFSKISLNCVIVGFCCHGNRLHVKVCLINSPSSIFDRTNRARDTHVKHSHYL